MVETVMLVLFGIIVIYLIYKYDDMAKKIDFLEHEVETLKEMLVDDRDDSF